jgi:Ca2+-binding EF-hand superfamily protein
VAQDTTNLTTYQLEEFEAVFLHFDGDRTNLLGATEFAAALASLGLNYPPKEMEDVLSVAISEKTLRFLSVGGHFKNSFGPSI